MGTDDGQRGPARPDEDDDGSGAGCLRDLVRSVLARVAPEIPGLGTGAELAGQVTAAVALVSARARADRELAALPPAARHTVLAGRVAMVLAFGEEAGS